MKRRFCMVAFGFASGLLAANCVPAEHPTVPSPPPRPGPKPAPVAPARPRGEVRCGAARCRVPDERCCHGAEGERCIPNDGTPYCPDRVAEYASAACDDATDCLSGEVCCLETTREGTQATRCGPHPCPTVEVCLPGGGACRDGFACRPQHGEFEGRCENAAPRASCGGKACSGDEPECCWSFAAELASCVPAGHCDRATATAFTCSSRADCGGYACCQVPGGFSCAGSCGGAGVLCAGLEDCPARDGVPASACAPLAGPAILNVKSCVYPAEAPRG